MCYEIKRNDPVVIAESRQGNKIRYPYGLYYQDRFMSNHRSMKDAEKQISGHRRRQAEMKLEEIQLARNGIYL